MRALLLIPILLGIASAEAATLRSSTTLHGPTVYLRDLFDDAGGNADRVLGPGPGPGGRIVVESAQLAAIARQFKVDWRPASKADRALLEWPGRPLPQRDALAAVRAALIAAGASDDCEVELPGFNPPLVPMESAARPDVTQLDYDPVSGRFSAVLTVLADGMDPINTRVTGRADDMFELPVPVTRLPGGAVLRSEDVRMMRVHASLVHGEVARALREAVGMQLKRQVVAGQPLEMAELTLPLMVQRGATVQMQLDSPGLSLQGKGVAMEAGAAGERIRVLNPSSRLVVEAEVVGPGVVRVSPASSARVAGAAGTTLVSR
jgi:flagella basal body P-ring formation protein FlgA